MSLFSEDHRAPWGKVGLYKIGQKWIKIWKKSHTGRVSWLQIYLIDIRVKTPSFGQIKAQQKYINIRKIKFGSAHPTAAIREERRVLCSGPTRIRAQSWNMEANKTNFLSLPKLVLVKFLQRSGINLSQKTNSCNLGNPFSYFFFPS